MASIEIGAKEVAGTFALTRRVLYVCGARLAGSFACRKAAEIIGKEIGEVTGRADIEEFSVHPTSFLGFIRVAVISYLVSTILLYFGYVIPALAGYLLAVLIAASQFIFYWELFDPFFKKRTGYNVAGVLEPAGEVKQQIILSGHHDSAYEFNFLSHMPKLYSFRIILSFAPVIIVFVMTIIWLVLRTLHGTDPGFAPWLRYGALIALVFVLPGYFFTAREGVPGAGDNMIATAIAIELGRLFRDPGKTGRSILKNTRLIILSVDAEEAGLRGARAYAKRHRAGLTALPAYNFNIDSIYNLNEIQFLTSDINGLQKLSKEMAAECSAIAHELGYSARLFAMTPGGGGTDAAEFAKIGVRATTLIAMPTNLIRGDIVYHTQRDVVSSIEEKAVEASLRIACMYIQRKDREVAGADQKNVRK